MVSKVTYIQAVTAILFSVNHASAFLPSHVPSRGTRVSGKSSLHMSAALIVQNKGGGHGELGKNLDNADFGCIAAGTWPIIAHVDTNSFTPRVPSPQTILLTLLLLLTHPFCCCLCCCLCCFIVFSMFQLQQDTSLQRHFSQNPRLPPLLFFKMMHAMTPSNLLNLTRRIFQMSKLSRLVLVTNP